jgi:orotidine-5'-phosphate decarboxylase
MSKARALKIAEEAAGLVWGFKVHDLLFHYGAEIVYELSQWGKVIADARLWGTVSEVRNAVRVLKTAGADVVTIMSGNVVDEGFGSLAGVNCLGGLDCGCIGLDYCVQDQGTTFNVRRDGETDLHVYGREVITVDNFVETLEKIASEIST